MTERETAMDALMAAVGNLCWGMDCDCADGCDLTQFCVTRMEAVRAAARALVVAELRAMCVHDGLTECVMAHRHRREHARIQELSQ